MKILIIVLIFTLLMFASLYFLLLGEIKNITMQLKKISKIDTNSKVLISTSFSDIQKLATQINKTISENKNTQVEYKRMDTQLREAIANVSHDLRTPLTSIKGYIQLLEDDSITDEERKQYIEVIRKRAESLNMLIAGFYDLSRLESDEYKFKLEKLNLHSILCDIAVSFYNDFKAKNIEPEISLDENIKEIIADENAVRRVFSNLIQNMLRYGKKFISISAEQSKGCIVTTFTNDAPNLTQKDSEHIFEKFFVADRTRNGKGTGLGLTIAKTLVEKMGNEISAELNDGKLSIKVKWKEQKY